ncbi:MAG TPA: hypothetical protein PKJ51_08840 [Methanothrix sp.]|nr:hypothetical protein [Methanothrix sp.]
MDEDEIVSVEEEIFYDYTVPSDIGLDGLDPSSNISNMTTDLPLELSSEVPLHCCQFLPERSYLSDRKDLVRFELRRLSEL